MGRLHTWFHASLANILVESDHQYHFFFHFSFTFIFLGLAWFLTLSVFLFSLPQTPRLYDHEQFLD